MFNTQYFRQDIFANLQKGNVEMDQLEKFATIFKTVLDRHAPTKKRYIRANQGSFINMPMNQPINSREITNLSFFEKKRKISLKSWRLITSLTIIKVWETVASFLASANSYGIKQQLLKKMR